MSKRSIHGFLMGVASVLLFAFQACAPAYIPNVVNAPLFSEEGEIVAKINSGISGFDPQVAYAVTDQIGVMVNGSFRSSQNEEVENYHRHAFGEIGVGYYKPLSEVARFEVFGGGGFGQVNANFTNSVFPALTNVSYLRSFMQPTIGLVTNWSELSVSSRIVYVLMFQDQLRSGIPFIEPVVTMKLGYKQVKGVLQMGFSLPVTPWDEMGFEHQPFMFSMGLQFRVSNPFLTASQSAFSFSKKKG